MYFTSDVVGGSGCRRTKELKSFRREWREMGSSIIFSLNQFSFSSETYLVLFL